MMKMMMEMMIESGRLNAAQRGSARACFMKQSVRMRERCKDGGWMEGAERRRRGDGEGMERG